MGKATVVDGRAIAGYIGDTAVDSEGKAIEGAPARPKNTDPSEQPGAINASTTSEERMGKAIAEGIAAAISRAPAGSGSSSARPSRAKPAAPVAPAAAEAPPAPTPPIAAPKKSARKRAARKGK